MAAIPTTPETIRESLTAQIDAADLPPFTKEALHTAFVPFAELFLRQSAIGTPETGRAVADATAAVAAAVIVHLHMNVRRPGVDLDTAIRDFVGVVELRVLRSLAADGLRPSDDGR